jgi:hypothetical protein
MMEHEKSGINKNGYKEAESYLKKELEEYNKACNVNKEIT